MSGIATSINQVQAQTTATNIQIKDKLDKAHAAAEKIGYRKDQNGSYFHPRTRETHPSVPSATALKNTQITLKHLDEAAQLAKAAKDRAFQNGWSREVDTNTQKPFYSHINSGICSWTVPNAREISNANQIAIAFQNGWIHTFDTNSQRPYYLHFTSGFFSWTPPTLQQISDANQLEKALQNGWTKQTDFNSGRIYYHHEQAKISTWEIPSPYLILEVNANRLPIQQTQAVLNLNQS
jgi:hypothetical protein